MSSTQSRAAVSEVVLVDKSRTPQIVVSPQASETERFAASELATYLQKISGRKIPIQKTQSKPQSSTPMIIIGRHPANAELAPLVKGLEETVMDVRPGLVRLLGGKADSITAPDGKLHIYEWGTLYAVYELLDELGVRWYRPESWGEHVPKLATVKLAIGRRHKTPVYKYRWGVSSYRNLTDETPEQKEMGKIWAIRNRQNVLMATPPDMRFPSQQGGTHWLNITHMYDTLFPVTQYFETHPEYYALVDGKRRKDGQLCLSNPEVQRLTAEKVIAFSREAPQFETHSLEPLDNDIWCQCENCKALDDPDLKAIWSDITIEWERPMGDVSMSNRVGAFGKIVANKVLESGQPIKILWLAYLTHTETPSRIKDLPKNVIIQPAAFSSAFSDPQESFSDYSRDLFDPASKPNKKFVDSLTGHGQLARMLVYEYWAGIAWVGPMPLIRTMKDRIQSYRKFPIDGIFSETNKHWGPQGIGLYFFTRLTWNPDFDIDKELDSYCRNYYGPAYKPMLEYHKLLEDAAHAGIPHRSYGIGTHAIFTPTVLKRMGELMDQAKALIGDKEAYKKRFEGVWAGYEYTRLVMPYFDELKKGDKLEAAKHWERANKLILSYKDGDVFDNGVAFGSLQFFGNYNLNIPPDIQAQARQSVAAEAPQ
jgi:hypothetical protein